MNELEKTYDRVTLIANSIGAFFAMNAGIEKEISRAYFISPVVDMEKLIRDMMSWAGVTESKFRQEGVVHTAFGGRSLMGVSLLCALAYHQLERTC